MPIIKSTEGADGLNRGCFDTKHEANIFNGETAADDELTILSNILIREFNHLLGDDDQ